MLAPLRRLLTRLRPSRRAPAREAVVLVPDFVEPDTLTAVPLSDLPPGVDPGELRAVRLGRLTLIVRIYLRRVDLKGRSS